MKVETTRVKNFDPCEKKNMIFKFFSKLGNVSEILLNSGKSLQGIQKKLM
jgi:hypothetical protein